MHLLLLRLLPVRHLIVVKNTRILEEDVCPQGDALPPVHVQRPSIYTQVFPSPNPLSKIGSVESSCPKRNSAESPLNLTWRCYRHLISNSLFSDLDVRQLRFLVYLTCSVLSSPKLLQMSKAFSSLKASRVSSSYCSSIIADSQDDDDSADEICPLVRAVMHLIKIPKAVICLH